MLYYTNNAIFRTIDEDCTMGTVRKTITFTQQQDQWIKAKIATGQFTNDSE